MAVKHIQLEMIQWVIENNLRVQMSSVSVSSWSFSSRSAARSEVIHHLSAVNEVSMT
jgi:hypothetical protein